MRVFFACAFATATMAFLTPAGAQKARRPAAKFNYVRQDAGLAFNRPADWEEGETEGVPDLLAGFFFHDGFPRPTITIATQPSFGADKLPMFRQGLEAGLRDRTPGYKHIKTITSAVGGVAALSITFKFSDTATSSVYRGRHTWVARGTKFSVFSLITSDRMFSRYEPAFDRMIKSVKWLPMK